MVFCPTSCLLGPWACGNVPHLCSAGDPTQGLLWATPALHPQSTPPASLSLISSKTQLWTFPCRRRKPLSTGRPDGLPQNQKVGDPEASVILCLLVSCVYSYQLISPVCHGTKSVGYHHPHPISFSMRETKNSLLALSLARPSVGHRPSSPAVPFFFTAFR